ncbi:DUF6692 family protein [Croceibacterium ferulae]|uniref:DUF6692 family protein n=1 Tax=Croceibacterium ferulae TaxID=1854641 RepID=UPI000EAF926A|nr:DUF6692 family protein [Croceibacterium ferulae]
MLPGCNSNIAPGNDREAQIDAAPTPAPVMGAAEALSGIAIEAVQPETMTDADIAALGGLEGRCAIRLTEVSEPSFLYRPRGSGAIKLNGKLIELSAAGGRRFVDGGLNVQLRPVEGEGNAGLPEHEMIVMLPGAQDELGFRGYRQCIGTAEEGE